MSPEKTREFWDARREEEHRRKKMQAKREQEMMGGGFRSVRARALAHFMSAQAHNSNLLASFQIFAYCRVATVFSQRAC